MSYSGAKTTLNVEFCKKCDFFLINTHHFLYDISHLRTPDSRLKQYWVSDACDRWYFFNQAIKHLFEKNLCKNVYRLTRKKERKKDENDSFETLFTKILPLLLPINWFLIAQFQISLKLMLFYNVMIGNLKHVIDY